MSRAAEAHMEGARAALKLAAEYRAEAFETTDEHRRAVCEWEAEEAEKRAAWYSAHAAMFTPKQKYRKAA
ncbi:hypothetical protein ABCW43_00315 [Neorhizobium sp. IRAMC:178]|uniref:hypothetical protein n=1 Tax=Neorhizobium tunisiense TaxID=3144793 RepID=UPI0031F6201D